MSDSSLDKIISQILEEVGDQKEGVTEHNLLTDHLPDQDSGVGMQEKTNAMTEFVGTALGDKKTNHTICQINSTNYPIARNPQPTTHNL